MDLGDEDSDDGKVVIEEWPAVRKRPCLEKQRSAEKGDAEVLGRATTAGRKSPRRAKK